MIKYHKAKWWETTESGKILCTLCPRYCKLGEGQKGFCFIRENREGELVTTGYGRPVGFAVDPIEKKPLSHFLPGTGVLSFGTAGCNLGCKFCQNWTTSKARSDEMFSLDVSPADVVELAKKYNTPSIAYTYNDPTIFGEYVIDVSERAREEGIKSVMVTAGYIDREARKDVYKNIDAANVDLKAFTEKFYHELTYSHLDNVLDTLLWLKNETDIWFELTTLLIPGKNDSPDEIKEMSEWILENLGPDIPVHFTAFHPDFKMKDTPRTPESTLLEARNTAFGEGMNYVYVGNVSNSEGQTTYCPNCSGAVITRNWHSVSENLLQGNRCPVCNSEVAGVFN